MKPSTFYAFGPWLPDLPELNNPGMTEATNVLPYDATYKPFLPLAPIASGTLPAQVLGAIYPVSATGGTPITITAVTEDYAGAVLDFYSVLIDTGSAHGLSHGDIFTIYGMNASGTYYLNGTWQVDSVVDSDSFYLADVSGAPSGSYVSGGFIVPGYSSALVAGVATDLYAFENGAWTKRSSATYSAATQAWEFGIFGDHLIATNGEDSPQVQLTPGTDFTILAETTVVPTAKAIGIVNDFVVLGDTPSGEHFVQWCAIGNDRNWPTPQSATAIASQSDEEGLHRELGAVCAIHGGDQFGVILQRAGVTRMTYVGPPAVFSFDTISRTRGARFRHASIQANGLDYFISKEGFQVTDGVTVKPIGDGKVDRYFLSNVNYGFADKVRAAHDAVKKLIKWSWADTSATNGQANRLIIYNYEEDRWSLANQVCDLVLTPAVTETTWDLLGFDANHCLASFDATAGSAVLTTGEVEFDPGDYAHLAGFKPLVTGTTPAVTVAIGTRNTQDPSDLTYTSETTATARTGFCDFRSEARYHRARITITGPFDKAVGGEPYVEGSGED